MANPYKEAMGNYWKPEKEDEEIEGILTRVEEKVGPNESMLYHVEQKGGEMIQVWGSTVLDMRMAQVKVGQELKIIYKGLAEKGGRGKNKPKLFKVLYRDPDVVTMVKEEFDIPED